MIHVIAIITTKPGKREEILGHFRANVPAVHRRKAANQTITITASGQTMPPMNPSRRSPSQLLRNKPVT